jgi:hypothetical protein
MNPWEGHIRMLVYVVQFESEPVAAAGAAVDRVLRDQPTITPAALRSSVRKALASKVRLSELIPQDHAEQIVRAFLAEAEKQLVQRGA